MTTEKFLEKMQNELVGNIYEDQEDLYIVIHQKTADVDGFYDEDGYAYELFIEDRPCEEYRHFEWIVYCQECEDSFIVKFKAIGKEDEPWDERIEVVAFY